ncbi:hypothetical protein ABVT39_009810 [Epinephelus coioides]
MVGTQYPRGPSCTEFGSKDVASARRQQDSRKNRYKDNIKSNLKKFNIISAKAVQEGAAQYESELRRATEEK